MDAISAKESKTLTSKKESNYSTDITEKEVAPEDPEREGFDNGIEFVLTCLGLAVGLGNIWRFPTRAYENGGSAFLIPYITCAICFGLPVIYLEFVAGQYNRVSPPIVFRRIRPVLEDTCIDMLAQKFCDPSYEQNQIPDFYINDSSIMKMVYINGTCQDAINFTGIRLLSATEQYYKNYIVRPSKSMFDINEINYPILISMCCCWFLTGLLILKGVKIMGKVSYVTVCLPYFIVFVLFVRGVTLDGASDGLYFYLGKPDFTKVFSIKTWTEALKQLCFSLSVGYGALMSLASYSKKRHNCFKDALIIIIGDTTMSLIGGTAVFSTLGFLAKQRGVGLPDVVESGFALTFVVYPEAMTQMPLPWLWGFLFFLMLFLLGVSTEIALVEVFCTCLYDRFPSLRQKKTIVVMVWCLILFSIGIVFSTDAGLYWLTMYDEYASGFSSVFSATVELLVLMYIYRAVNFKDDMLEMMGEPRSPLTAAIGPHSPYFTWNWRIISPLIGVVLMVLSFIREYPFEGKPEVYPPFFDIFGWFIAFLPISMVLVFACVNYILFRKKKYPLEALLSLQKQHPSFSRIVDKLTADEQEHLDEILPDTEPWTVVKPQPPQAQALVAPPSALIPTTTVALGPTSEKTEKSESSLITKPAGTATARPDELASTFAPH